jgi:hypothetical protein
VTRDSTHPASEAAASEEAASPTASAPAPPVRAKLLDVAQLDSANAARYVQSVADFARRGELLIQEVPRKFLELVDAMRASVRAFNDALVQPEGNPIPHVRWHETPNIALRDPFTGDGMMVRISRLHSSCELVLRYVSRNLKPDVPIIEGYGDFGVEGVRRKVLIRIEGWVENGAVTYWYNLDFKRRDIPLVEVPDRIVMAVARSDYSLLTRNLGTRPVTTPETVSPDPAQPGRPRPALSGCRGAGGSSARSAR